MKKCKILHIAPGFKYGGIESRMVDWYEIIDKERFSFDIVKVTPEEPNSLVEKLRAMGANVISIPSFRHPIKHFIQMRRVLKTGEYSAVHAHSPVYGFFPLLYAKLHGIKVRILHSRTTKEGYGKMNFAEKLIISLSVRLSTNLFACSHDAGTWIFGKREFEVINNGIKLNDFRFDPAVRMEIRGEFGLNDSFVIGNVGRFSRVKNLPLLVDILKRLSEDDVNAKLVLVGDDLGDDIESTLKQKAKELDVLDKIVFAGRSEKVQDWLNAFDVFMFPSFHEGFGTVAIEAQANGLPCVISTGVPKEVKVLDDVFFADPNDVENWHKTIKDLIGVARKSADVEKLSACGYDINSSVLKLSECYKNAD